MNVIKQTLLWWGHKFLSTLSQVLHSSLRHPVGEKKKNNKKKEINHPDVQLPDQFHSFNGEKIIMTVVCSVWSYKFWTGFVDRGKNPPVQKLTLHQFNYIQIKEYNCTEDASPSERVKLVWNLYRSRMKSANYCQTELRALIKKK